MMDSNTRLNSSAGFHESDYHTPRTRRKLRLLERKSVACMCTGVSVFLVLLIALAVTVSLRVTGSRDSFEYQETLGDTRLVPFNPSYCHAIYLESKDAVASMHLLRNKPPLTGWSNISFDSSFVITESTEYVDNYGWYDYGADAVYLEDIDYVTWNFHLNKGSVIHIDTCHEGNPDDSATFVLVEGKTNYANWRDNLGTIEGNQIPKCLTTDNQMLTVNHKVAQSNEYYLIFYSPTDSSPTDSSPRVNLTIELLRTEYVIDTDTNPSCTTSIKDKNNCQINVPLGGQRYALLEVGSEENNKIKYGDKVTLTWVCFSRSWVYILIFACPVIFFTLLFVAMYCVITVFWNRKLKSYETLRNGMITNESNSSAFKIVYEHPEKRSMNLIASTQ